MKEQISKRKWLVIAIIIVLILIGIAVFLGVSGILRGQEQEGSDVTVSLSASSIQLDIYETLELKAQVQGSDEAPVWTTGNSAVATVENGVVTAVGEGTTDVIVTVGEASCACQVSVVNSYTAPVIAVNTPNIGLGLNEQYDLSVRLLWKGAEVTDHPGFAWSLAEGGVAEVVSVEQTANGASITALAYGKTSYTVSTTYRGQLVARKVDIKVTNLDITFEIDNMEKSVWAYSTALGLIETDEDITSIAPNVTVYNKGVKVDGAVITWQSENPEIATVDENGKITAVSAGTARIVGWYDNAEIPIDVEVYRTKILRTDVDIEQANDYTLSISGFSGSGEITDVLYDGESVLKEIKDGQLILNSEMLPEIGKEVKLSILSEKAEYTTEGMMATFVINSEYELKQFPKYQDEYPTGYYALGNNVTCSGTFASSAKEAFNGTFDGRGYAIYNMTTSDESRYGRGLFGSAFGVPGKSNAVLKNIAFINAKHSKDGAFLAQQGGGLLENVYINIALSDLVTNGGQNKTTVLFSYMYNTVAMDKVFIEHIEPLADVGATGYAITHLGYYGNIQGLYIIGGEKVCEKVVDNKSSADVIGIYPNYREFLASGRNLNGWSNDFWATYNKIPYPAGRNIHANHMPEVTAPEEALTGTKVTIQGLSMYDEIVVPAEMKKLGVKVEDNVLILPENMSSGTVMNITVRSVFNHNKAVQLSILVNYAEHLYIDEVVYAERLESDQFTVDLSSLATELEGTTLKNASYSGTQFTTAVYENGVLTLDTASLGDAAGEKDVIAVFAKGEDLVVVNIKAFACDMVFTTAAELKNFPAVAKEHPDGYYALGADIYYTGTYSNTNTDPFTGTFDGCGYVIFNMTTKSSYDDWDGGFFGKEFRGTLKNIAFQNAIVKGQGAFLAFRTKAGTLENVYLNVSFDGLVSGLGWINDTSVLFNDGTGDYLYATNVIVEYAEALTASAGYAFYQNVSVSKLEGLYVVGANKISAGTMPGSSTAYGCYTSRASFKANVSAWDGNGFWTVVDGFPIPNRLVNYEPPKEPETVTLDSTVYLEKNSVQSTFTVDLSSLSDKLSGLELTNATVDGVAFATKSYDAETGILTLDRATLNDLQGETTVAVNFGELLQVKVKIVLCTQVIDTVAELKNFPALASANPNGYFALGADIWFEGEYSNTNTAAFTGTFDGCGHVIYNMTTKTAYDDWDGGFFGKLFQGTLKNIAFQNAIVKGQGAFLAFRAKGATLKDVYIYAAFDGLVSGLGWINDTSVLFNDGEGSYLYATNVIVEYAEPLTGASAGYPFYQNISVTHFNGLYAVGADKISAGTMPGSSTAYGCYDDRASFDADVSAWDGNGFWTVVDGFPIPNGLLNPSTPPEPEETVQLQLTDKVLVDLSSSDSTFTVSFGDQQSALADVALETAAVDGTSFTTGSYADGILTLDKATLGTETGEKTVQATFTGNRKTVQVEIPVVVCTQVIDTAEELRSFPAAAKANPGGYFALGADIWFEGEYSNTNTAAFTGIFDGCGHVIYNMSTKTAYDDWDGGFFGKLFQGTLKNIAFQNATVKGQGAFLAFRTNGGTLENVYLYVCFDNMVSGLGWINDTSVLFNDGNGNYLYATNVIVEYAEPLTGASAGYAFYQNLSVSKLNGLYVVGADKISTAALPGSSTAYGCYADRASFDADVSAWDGNGFWTVVDGFPIPNVLVDYDPANPPEPPAPEETEPEETEPEETEPEETEPTEVIQLQLTDTVLVDMSSSDSTFTVSLSDQQSTVAGVALETATVDGTSFTTYTYADGILTLDKATFGTKREEKTVQVTFTGTGKAVQVKIPVAVCTKVFYTADDLRSFPTLAKSEPGGYYALGGDIHFTGTYENTNTVPFTGTFDGQGYTVYDLCTKVSATDWDGGLFGKFFGKEDGSTLATLKNISFINATVKGQGAFLACKGQGTLENVYMQVVIDGLVSNYTTNGWINNTSVLFNTVPSHHIYINNVILEYAEPLTDNNSWGYAFGSLNTLATIDGLYIVGADRAYNSLMNGSTAVAMGCYADAAAFQAAGIDFTAWYETGFWMESENKTPVPKK